MESSLNRTGSAQLKTGQHPSQVEFLVLLRFQNIHGRFIHRNDKVPIPLKQLIKKTEASLRGKKGAHSAKLEWIRQAKLALRILRRIFTEALIL